ncbi:MAG: ABC transporter permease subunit [Candidatus Brocadiae bacterium]|nr:ABC transporter permease subunit [Candidatus Brocadiia bacterium]
MQFPVRIPVGRWVEEFIKWFTDHSHGVLSGLTSFVDTHLKLIHALLDFLPWPATILIFMMLAWKIAGKSMAFWTAFFLFLLGSLGLWQEGMDTFAMVVVSVFLCILVGLPLGILSAQSKTFQKLLLPCLDGMQTIPSFVYLIPAVLLFGIGNVPGIIATVIFASVPMVRLTDLGIRQVPLEKIEAGISFGCNRWELLTKIQLPLALPSIMTGVNQTVMMSLSMVVTAAMIGAKGLGISILKAIQQVELGLGVEAGLGILFIAILLDRILQNAHISHKTAFGSKSQKGFWSWEKWIASYNPLESKRLYYARCSFAFLLLGIMAFLAAYPLWLKEKKQDSDRNLSGKEKIIIGGLSWSGSQAIEQIMKQVLEEKLGIGVEIKNLAPSVLWTAMDQGSVHIFPDMWMPNQEEGFNKYVRKSQSNLIVKISYDNAPQGFYIPTKIAKQHNIKTVHDLKGKEQIFDYDGDGMGEIWVGPFGWMATEINVSKLKEYDLALQPLKIEQWLFLAMLKEAMRKEKPILFYYWEPEWPMAMYDLTLLQEPEYDESKWIYSKGNPDKTHISCAYPPATVYIGISKKLQETHPEAYNFLMNWYIPIQEVSFLITEIEDVPGNSKKSPDEVARDWIKKHPDIIKQWLKK